MKENASKKIEYGNVSNPTYRILADGVTVNNDTWVTGRNNNDLVLGPSGAGKTQSYVLSNILQANESMVVADTKGNLMEKCGPALEKQGYRVLLIDFKTMNSTCRWNPLEYIAFDEKRGCYSEQDIGKVSRILCPTSNMDDPIWDDLASQYLSCLIAYVLDFLPEDEHNFDSVVHLFDIMDSPEFLTMMREAINKYPSSTVARYYQRIEGNKDADKFHASIKGVLGNHIRTVAYDSAIAMYEHPNCFRFRELGQSKMALFVNISDTDRSLDDLVSLFYTQAFQDIIDYADQECPGQRLPVPVRFILDDFATNIRIEDFDKLISVIRSREVYASVILQSITQLYGLYGRDRGNSIIDNCDTILYLGGQSLETAEYISARTNLPESAILDMPIDEAYLIIRGEKPRKVHKYDIRKHERYNELDEAQTECIDNTINAFPDIESAQDA